MLRGHCTANTIYLRGHARNHYPPTTEDALVGTATRNTAPLKGYYKSVSYSAEMFMMMWFIMMFFFGGMF
jgi:hypothetical protein